MSNFEESKQFLDVIGDNPKFTGDVLWHMRIHQLISFCHKAKIMGSTFEYYSAITSFYAEVKYWNYSKDKNKIEKIEAVLKTIGHILCQKPNEQILFSQQIKLNVIFTDLNFLSQKNGIITQKKNTDGGAIADGD